MYVVAYETSIKWTLFNMRFIAMFITAVCLHDQPQSGSFSQRQREKAEREPGNEVEMKIIGNPKDSVRLIVYVLIDVNEISRNICLQILRT